MTVTFSGVATDCGCFIPHGSTGNMSATWGVPPSTSVWPDGPFVLPVSVDPCVWSTSDTWVGHTHIWTSSDVCSGVPDETQNDAGFFIWLTKTATQRILQVDYVVSRGANPDMTIHAFRLVETIDNCLSGGGDNEYTGCTGGAGMYGGSVTIEVT